MSAQTEAKAERLLADGHVHKVDEERPRLFMVDSSAGDRQYRVVIGRYMSWCDCPAGGRAAECSHQRAARMLFERENAGSRL